MWSSRINRARHTLTGIRNTFNGQALQKWANATSEISWSRPFNKLLDESNLQFSRWFVGGILNTCYNCVDRHVESGNGKQIALVYSSPVTNTKSFYSYEMLLKEVTKFACLLQNQGVAMGDRVVIYMPNSPQAVFAMLACARIGAIHCVVFGGFAASELAVRIKDCKPKVMVYSTCGIEGSKVIEYGKIVNEALHQVHDVHRVDKCIIYERPECKIEIVDPSRDMDWNKEMQHIPHDTIVPPVAVDSSHPLYVLYTSGTTGQPKGIVRDNGGHAVALKWAMKHVFGMNPGDVWWAASDVGWVVGHSFGVYGPLLHRCTTVLYEGKPVGTPDAGAFWKLISDYKVNGLFTAPTALRAIKKVDPHGAFVKKYDISSLRTLFLAGERADPASIKWAEQHVGVPVRDNWWQTESGWPITANTIANEGYLPIKYGSAFKPCMGYDVRVFENEDTTEITTPGIMGRIAIKLPTPPGFMQTLYNNNERYLSAYMTSIPGYYDTGDAGMIDHDGYVHIMTRTDDVINVAGHRLSTGSMEEILADHTDIAEVAVIGIKDELKGQVPFALIVLHTNTIKSEDQIKADVIQMVRDRIGAVACFKDAIYVPRLPKTRSGKILRGTLRSIADGMTYKIPATIEDITVLNEVEQLIRNYKTK